ncbi:AAA family ATPase [bacterium]|nr:AAA family ATPase [bacterium]
MLPHIARRFLEAFLLFKIPNRGDLKSKLDKIITDSTICDKVYRFINVYSHHSELERSIRYVEFPEMKDVIKNIMDSIKNSDKEHYNTIVKEVEIDNY